MQGYTGSRHYPRRKCRIKDTNCSAAITLFMVKVFHDESDQMLPNESFEKLKEVSKKSLQHKHGRYLHSTVWSKGQSPIASNM